MSAAKIRPTGPDSGDGPPSPPSRRARLLRIAAIVVAGLLVLGLGVLALTLTQATAPPVAGPPSTAPSKPAPTPTESGTGGESATPEPSEPGSIDGSPAPVADPVDLGEIGTIAPGLTAEIVGVEVVDGTARGPGEIAGEALRVTVSIANGTSSEASLQTAVVSAYSGPERDPAPELREPGGRPLPQSVDAMSDAEGVYLFTVPEAARDDVTIIVDYSVDVAPLVFRGDVRQLIVP